MAANGSVTRWLNQIKTGDAQAAQKLWERYFVRLVGLARKKLQSAKPRGADEEDVALSVFDSFCRGAEKGRFPQLEDRDNLWRLLVVLTANKAANLLRDEGRLKRGGKGMALSGSEEEVGDLEQLLSREPTPEFAASVAEEYVRLLHRLKDRALENIAIWKMEGYTNQEIAAKLKCTPRTVFRKLSVIRGVWEEELAS